MTPPRPAGEVRGPSLRSVLLVTVPAHAALPVALWALHRDVATTAWLVLALHGVGAAAILATVRWWWGRFAELLVVLVLDHVATFAVGTWLLG